MKIKLDIKIQNLKELNEWYNQIEKSIKIKYQNGLDILKKEVELRCPIKVGDKYYIPEGYPGYGTKHIIEIIEISSEIDSLTETIRWVVYGILNSSNDEIDGFKYCLRERDYNTFKKFDKKD